MPTDTDGPPVRPAGVAASLRLVALAAALALAGCGEGSGSVGVQPAGPQPSGSASQPSGSPSGSPGPAASPSGSPGPAASPSGAPGSTSGTPGGPASPGAGAGTALRITVTDADGRRTTTRLACDPPGGNHPAPAAACRALSAAGARALPPVPPDRACTQVYGGDELAVVTGRWRGRSVEARFSRVNGCEIDRWDALRGLLPAAGA
jgi:hypothetical protein